MCLQIRHQDQIIYVNASPWCARKVKDCIIAVCAPPPHFLHRLYLSLLLLSANLCMYHIVYICTRTHSRDETPNTHKMSVGACITNKQT